MTRISYEDAFASLPPGHFSDAGGLFKVVQTLNLFQLLSPLDQARFLELAQRRKREEAS